MMDDIQLAPMYLDEIESSILDGNLPLISIKHTQWLLGASGAETLGPPGPGKCSLHAPAGALQRCWRSRTSVGPGSWLGQLQLVGEAGIGNYTQKNTYLRMYI